MDSPPQRPPPRSSSIKANLCKLLTGKATRSSYALNSKRKLTKSGWSCSSLSTVANSAFDHPANCSLTRLTEEHDPSRAMRNLSLSKSSDLIAASISSPDGCHSDTRQTHQQKVRITSVPVANSDCSQEAANNCHVKTIPLAVLSEKVVMRDKNGISSSMQHRPKSEYTISNPVAPMRGRRVNRANARSTIEVSFPTFICHHVSYSSL